MRRPPCYDGIPQPPRPATCMAHFKKPFRHGADELNSSPGPFPMTTSLLALFTLPILAAPFDDGAAVELRYTGALSKAGRAADSTAVKRFNLYALAIREPDGGRRITYFLNERGAGGWSWPERYGSIALDSQLKPVTGAGIR